MSHYVVSDVHGEDDRWKAMLEKIHFSAQDTLYILGDVVDRGPHGVEILQEIMRTPNMKMLLGNHEFMCRDILRRMHRKSTSSTGIAMETPPHWRDFPV